MKRVAGIEFKNPILLASGTAGFGVEPFYEDYPLELLGGIVTKTITLHKRQGNPPPRIAEIPCGMMNSIGLENPGLEYFMSDIAGRLEKVAHRTNVIVSIGGESVEEYREVARSVSKLDFVKAIEVNVSCPNIVSGTTFDMNLRDLGEVVEVVREAALGKPIFVKVSPNGVDILEKVKVVKEKGADGVVIANTFLGVKLIVDKSKREVRWYFEKKYAGVSGPALKPIVQYMVSRAKEVLGDFPIVAVGGIGSVEDVIEYLWLGASLVQIGSVFLRDPEIPYKVAQELSDYLDWCWK